MTKWRDVYKRQAPTQAMADEYCEKWVQKLRTRFGDACYGFEDTTLAQAALDALLKKDVYKRQQYYLRFWLSSCRTSLAVSALSIMRYCLKNNGGVRATRAH